MKFNAVLNLMPEETGRVVELAVSLEYRHLEETPETRYSVLKV